MTVLILFVAILCYSTNASEIGSQINITNLTAFLDGNSRSRLNLTMICEKNSSDTNETCGNSGDFVVNPGIACAIYAVSMLPKRLEDLQAKRVSPDPMDSILATCKIRPEKLSDELIKDVTDVLQTGRILGGTKWCGDGDRAKNFSDFGFYEQLDRCCFGHDRCTDYILKGETKFNLTNDSEHSRVSCDCDEDFRVCLKQVRSSYTENILASTVGVGYFDYNNNKCYKKDHPQLCCLEFNTFNTKCTTVRLDYSKPKAYQWWNVKSFTDHLSTDFLHVFNLTGVKKKFYKKDEELNYCDND